MPVRKVLESAIANADHNHGLDARELVLARVTVDEGPTIRRFRPRAMGRATRIRKRTCHITDRPRRDGARLDPWVRRSTPTGFRLGILHDWKSNWFSEREFAKFLDEDRAVRDHITRKLSHAGLSDDPAQEGPNQARSSTSSPPARAS